MSTAKVLGLFDGVTRRDLRGCPKVKNARNEETTRRKIVKKSASDTRKRGYSGSKCDLPRLVDNWLQKQDKIAKENITDDGARKKYVSFFTLKRALDSANMLANPGSSTRNVDNVIPDTSSIGLESWLAPKSVDLNERREQLKEQISELRFEIAAVSRYYALQDEARTRIDKRSKVSPCKRCILLIEFKKLQLVAKLFGNTKSLVKRSGGGSVNIGDITFPMLESQLSDIRNWDALFQRWLRNNRPEDGDSAWKQLDNIIDNMISDQKTQARNIKDQERASWWVGAFDEDCAEVNTGSDGEMPALVWD